MTSAHEIKIGADVKNEHATLCEYNLVQVKNGGTCLP